jgi:anti-sigma factor RsiW
MNCSHYRESLHELLDGTIGPLRGAELERHLDTCADCRALLEDLRVIHDTAAALEPLEPPDGVWLQIAGRLRQEGRVAAPPVVEGSVARRHMALLALAAALVLAVGASVVLLWPQFRAPERAGLSEPASTPSAAGPSAAAPAGNAKQEVAVESVEEEFRLAEQHYQNAIAKLEQAARLDQPAANSGTLDAQTAAMLQKNLQVIDQAIAESRAALRAEPQSAPARDSLFDALRRKVALLQDTIALMNEMRKGNSAGAAQILNKS